MEGDNLQVNRNPIRDCEGWWLPPLVYVVQWLEYTGSQGPWVWFNFTLPQLLNMCLLQAEASRCKQVNKTGKV